MPFDEIVANPSDLKHVVELSRSTDGLGAVVTVVLYHFCVFYMRFPNSAKWFGTEVGTSTCVAGAAVTETECGFCPI